MGLFQEPKIADRGGGCSLERECAENGRRGKRPIKRVGTVSAFSGKGGGQSLFLTERE